MRRGGRLLSAGGVSDTDLSLAQSPTVRSQDLQIQHLTAGTEFPDQPLGCFPS